MGTFAITDAKGADYALRQAYLVAIFATIQHPDNWKNPINVLVTDSAMTRELLSDAIVHFTGGYVRVTARGYYAVIGS
jgi:hypothetical protein